jgi:hypothetical protein
MMSAALEQQRQTPISNEADSEKYHGLKAFQKIDAKTIRPTLESILVRCVHNFEETLCSRQNLASLAERGVCFVSLENGIKSCSIHEGNSDLLQNLYRRTINLEDGSFITPAEAISIERKRCPRFWIVLINCYMVDFDQAIFDFLSSNLNMEDCPMEVTLLKDKIRHGKCILIVRWSNESKELEIVSCALFLVGNECIVCPYIATSDRNHHEKECGPSADSKPYRRRRLVRLLLAHLQLISINVFCWSVPKLVLQADPNSSGPIECFKKLGFGVLDYQYFMDDPIPDLTDDAVPFKFESRLWKIFIQDSQRIRYGSINPLARYFRFYMTSVIVAGVNSGSTTIIRKKMVPLEDFIRVRGTLDIFWMQDLTLEAKDHKHDAAKCCALNQCMHHKNKKITKPVVHQYAYCMYCKKGCHPECCYSREVGYDRCVPIDMFHSYRPPEVYGTCLLCESKKMKKGTLCKHNEGMDRSGDGVMTATCRKQHQKIHTRHRCLRCDVLIHPECCTYVLMEMHSDIASKRKGGLGSPHQGYNSIHFPENLYIHEPICDPCRLNSEYDVECTECIEHKRDASSCQNEETIEYYHRCYLCGASIHANCAIRMPNPNCTWDWSSPGQGLHWPGSELLYCSSCDVVRKYTVIPIIGEITKRMNDPDLVPNDIDTTKMVMGSYIEKNNVFEANKRLEHQMEIGKEVMLYSLDPVIYWEQTIMRLFFYLIAQHLPDDVGLIHDGFNIGSIKKRSYTMTSGWETKRTILQWVFQAGGVNGKDSRRGHWSLIVYQREITTSGAQYMDPRQIPINLGKSGMVRVMDSLEEPDSEFYTKMVQAVLLAMGWHEGKKPAKTLYLPKYKRVKRNSALTENTIDPTSKLNRKRWVIYEDPEAMMLLHNPDCGPITCVEALKHTNVGFQSVVNSEIELKDVVPAFYRQMILHLLGQMLNEGINHNIFDYSKLGVETNKDSAVYDVFSTRMRSVARDYDCGWGNKPFKELCVNEECPICKEDIWDIGSCHAKFTCYVSCSCSKRMHLDCFVQNLCAWDKMNLVHSPYDYNTYREDCFLGRIFKCPACNEINEPGLLVVHHCDGSLITIQPLPRYDNPAFNGDDPHYRDTTQIPMDARIEFVPRRRNWLRLEIFPIVWEEAKFLTYFNADSKTYANLKSDGLPITSDNILLISDLSISQEPSVNEGENSEQTRNNDDSINDPSKDVDNDGREKEKDKSTSTRNDTNHFHGSDTESDATNHNENTGNKDKHNNLETEPVTGKKRRRQRKCSRGGHFLTIQDDADAKVVWDVYNNVPPDYCRKDDVQKNLPKYWTKDQADREGEKLFWGNKDNTLKIKTIREGLVKARARKEKRRIEVLLKDERELLQRLDTEKNIQRYDQLIRLKYVGAKTSRVRNPKGKGLIQQRTPACWYGMVLNGHVTTCLETKWVKEMFPKPILEYIKENASRFVDVPPGAAGDTLMYSNLENDLRDRWSPPDTRPVIWAHQNQRDWKCLYYSTASVLYYLGDGLGASVMRDQGNTLNVLSYEYFVYLMRRLGYLGYKVQKQFSNISKEYSKDYLMIGQLCGMDGGTEHVIGMVDELIFDCNNMFATPMTDYSINACCGTVGFKQFHRLFVFSKKYQVTKERNKMINRKGTWVTSKIDIL